MHFFTAAIFAWMFIEVFDMYRKFVKILNASDTSIYKSAMIGWGFPSVLVIATLAAHFALVENNPLSESMRMYPIYRETVV